MPSTDPTQPPVPEPEDRPQAGPPPAGGERTAQQAGAPSPVVDSRARRRRPRATVAGRVWIAIATAVLVLVLLIVFIAENTHDAKISFLGASGHFPIGLALLVAAVAGVVLTLLVGSTRILQLRREVRRHSRNP